MKFCFKILECRYLLSKLFNKFLLGDLYGVGFLEKNVRDIDEECKNTSFSSSVVERKELFYPYVQKYDFDDSFGVEFPRNEVFQQKNIYLLRDVVLAPVSGGMFCHKKYFLTQSIGSIRRIHTRNLVVETLMKPQILDIDEPILSIGVASHYHFLIESLPSILHALRFYPNLKLLIPNKFPKYFSSICDLLNIDPSRIIFSDKPVQVKKGILLPKHLNSGFVHEEDVKVLKDFFTSHIDKYASNYSEKIYISRSKTINRKLLRELELEHELEKLGFKIVYFENMSLLEQLSFIYHSKFIVAPHGAGLANLIVAQRSTKVLEILSRNWFNTCYAKLSIQLGLEYSFIETKIVNNQTSLDVESIIKKIKSVCL